MIGPSDVEMRVLGCLVEKQRTTPDAYPLTLNSLKLACNQSTNRDPVVDYDEAIIRKALGELGRRRWIRSASGHTGRSPKYRHLIDTELNLPDDQISVLAVLMLRGPQTPGERKQRVERLHHFESLGEVQTTLEDLIDRDLVERLPRRPGQKEERYRQLVGGDTDIDGNAIGEAPAHGSAPGEVSVSSSNVSSRAAVFDSEPGSDLSTGGIEESGLAERVAALEAEILRLKVALEAHESSPGHGEHGPA